VTTTTSSNVTLWPVDLPGCRRISKTGLTVSYMHPTSYFDSDNEGWRRRMRAALLAHSSQSTCRYWWTWGIGGRSRATRSGELAQRYRHHQRARPPKGSSTSSWRVLCAYLSANKSAITHRNPTGERGPRASTSLSPLSPFPDRTKGSRRARRQGPPGPCSRR